MVRFNISTTTVGSDHISINYNKRNSNLGQYPQAGLLSSDRRSQERSSEAIANFLKNLSKNSMENKQVYIFLRENLLIPESM